MWRIYLLCLGFFILPCASYAAATGEPVKLSAWATVKRRMSMVINSAQQDEVLKRVEEDGGILPAVCLQEEKDEDLLVALKDRNNHAALIVAVKAQNLQKIKDIKPTPEMVNRLDETGKSVLHYAAAETSGVYGSEVLKVLLKDFKGNPNVLDSYRNTPLHIIASSAEKDPFQAKVVLEHGGLRNERNKEGKTPLMLAAEQNNLSVTRVLLASLSVAELSLYVNTAAWISRRTALHFAAMNSSGLSLVRILCQHGADRSLRDAFGYTALEYAQQKGNSLIVTFFSSNNDSAFFVHLCVRKSVVTKRQSLDE